MQKVFKKSTFQALPSVLFFLRNEAQLSEKYRRRRPGWCISLLPGKEKYCIKIPRYRRVIKKSTRDSVLAVHQPRRKGKEKYYIKMQEYRKVLLTVSWLVHMSSARRGSCATNPHSFCNQPFSNHSDHLQPLFRNMYIL